MMKIAVPYENGQVAEHFGHAAQFMLYGVSDTGERTSELVTAEDTDHAAVAALLRARGADVLLCGSIGDGAKAALSAEQIVVFSGASGSADDAAEKFLAGTLEAVNELTEGGNCSCEGDCGGGCGGGCGGCHGCHGTPEPYVETRTFTEIVHLTEENFEEEVVNDPALIVIDFWAEWCEPCRMMAPIFEELNREEDRVKFCKVDVDAQPQLAAMFGIDSIPTLAVVQARCTLTGMVGVRSKEEIKRMLDLCKS